MVRCYETRERGVGSLSATSYAWGQMRISPRAVFAVLLWAIAAWPVVLIAIAVSAPLRAVRLELAVTGALGTVAVWGLGAAAIAILLWPPFLPGLRLWLRRLKLRLSLNRLPVYEALDRLRSFENAADHLVAGRGLLAQGQPRLAAQHLARAIELDPADPRARFELAEAARRLGAVADAEALLTDLVAKDPEYGFGDALLRLCDLQLRLGSTAKAALGLERYVSRYGKKREALFLLARARLDSGDRPGTREVLRDAVRPLAPEERRDPSHAYWRGRARVLGWTLGGGA